MENINFEGVNLAELLPRIPDSVKNGLPFGIVKLDLVGTILEYNMAEGELTGVDPKWAIGKNFFSTTWRYVPGQQRSMVALLKVSRKDF